MAISKTVNIPADYLHETSRSVPCRGLACARPKGLANLPRPQQHPTLVTTHVNVTRHQRSPPWQRLRPAAPLVDPMHCDREPPAGGLRQVGVDTDAEGHKTLKIIVSFWPVHGVATARWIAPSSSSMPGGASRAASQQQ